ncbi:MAG: hypothetical protein EON60_00080 [Alphaproteobacteria bacterium]|nr:MAG: hypothetical protein EON60_00080 [Alphaproteobacteria bacterium]
MNRTAVMYLDRKVNPPKFARRFLRGLRELEAGAEYDLVYILKGYNEGEPCPALQEHEALGGKKAQVFYVPDTLFALGTMQMVARQLAHERILIFLSWTRLETANWLAPFEKAMDRQPNCGAVGATGSYEMRDERTPYPNYHVRTTAFMMKRELYLEMTEGRLGTATDEYELEAGPDNLTKRMMARGMNPLVVDRFGAMYEIPEWYRAGTFRRGEQEGLIASDNRTYDYEVSGPWRRRYLIRRAWGKQAKFKWKGWIARLKSAWRWHYGER